jgi:hypothetical protein
MEKVVRSAGGTPIVTVSEIDGRVYQRVGMFGCALNADEAQEWSDALSEAAGKARGSVVALDPAPTINTPAARFMRLVKTEGAAA